MLHVIGTALGSFQQFHIQQKSKGLGLLVFIFLAILLAKWNNWFKPFVDTLGITEFAKHIGLIQSTSVMTLLVLFLLIVVLLSILSVFLYFGTILQSIFVVAPMPVKVVLLVPLLMVTLPLILVARFFKKADTMEDKKENLFRQPTTIKAYLSERELALFENYEEKGEVYQFGATYLDQYTTRVFTIEEAARFLNKTFAHAGSTSNILVGFSRSLQRWFLIGAQPLPRYVSASANYSMTDLRVFGEALEKSFRAEDMLHVPAQGLYIEWDANKNEFTVITEPSEADARYRLSFRTCIQPIEDFKDIRMVSGGPFDNLMENSEHSALTAVMHNLHVLAYALPEYYPEEFEKYHIGERNYVTAAAAVSNYSALKQVYIADVLTFLASHLRQHPDDLRAQNAYHQIQRTYN